MTNAQFDLLDHLYGQQIDQMRNEYASSDMLDASNYPMFHGIDSASKPDAFKFTDERRARPYDYVGIKGNT